MRGNVITFACRTQVLSLYGMSVLLSLIAARAVLADKRPNVIVIYTDDHGFADLGCQGIMDDIRTPNIDRMAAAGVRMTDGYSSAPQCVPSRGGLITGSYQNRFGLESNPQGKEPAIMDRI